MHLPLVLAQRRRRLLADVAVERAVVDAAPREQELEHGDVPAEVAARGASASRRAGARAGRGRAASACRRRRPAGRFLRWNAWTAAAVCGPGEPVDRAEVEAVRAQGDLEPGDLRVHRRVGGRRQEDESQHEQRCCTTHGFETSAAARDLLPARVTVCRDSGAAQRPGAPAARPASAARRAHRARRSPGPPPRPRRAGRRRRCPGRNSIRSAPSTAPQIEPKNPTTAPTRR